MFLNRSSASTATATTTILLLAILALSTTKTAQGKKYPYTPITDPDNVYTWPAEDTLHEGTWLQWPHNYGWDRNHVRRYEESWVQLTEALHKGENVHIIAYNSRQKRRIRSLLKRRGIDMAKVDFYTYPTDDVWVRDNGPIFALDKDGKMMVEDWSFNGWGNKADWWFDDHIPQDVAWEMYDQAEFVPMVNEGGSIEVDGRGTLMAKRSSILNRNRNPGWSQDNVEEYFRRYLGVTNFIWLDGTVGADITDDHIDGTARFANGDTIVTMDRDDLVDPNEFDVLSEGRDVDGKKYSIVKLPITSKKVVGLDDYGIYINYYVGNEVVIVPSYGDPNDDIAADVLQGIYPNQEMVQIDFTELYSDGGLVHCVTMQQPSMA